MHAYLTEIGLPGLAGTATRGLAAAIAPIARARGIAPAIRNTATLTLRSGCSSSFDTEVGNTATGTVLSRKPCTETDVRKSRGLRRFGATSSASAANVDTW